MILITGGGGFIGCNTARELIDRGEDVLLVDKRSFEIPGFLSFLVIFLIILVREQVLGLSSLVLLGAATAVTAYFPQVEGPVGTLHTQCQAQRQGQREREQGGDPSKTAHSLTSSSSERTRRTSSADCS